VDEMQREPSVRWATVQANVPPTVISCPFRAYVRVTESLPPHRRKIESPPMPTHRRRP